MILKNIFFLCLLLVLSSFNFIKLDKSIIFGNDATFVYQSKYSFSDSRDLTCFECEDFISNALNNYTIATINKEFLSLLNCTKELVVNKHDSATIDTVYTFSNSKNKIQIYRANQNDFIFTFDVTDPVFNLKGNVKPGMTKDDFLRKFRITETKNNKVKISNSEGNMGFVFYFENSRLKRINSYLYLD